MSIAITTDIAVDPISVCLFPTGLQLSGGGNEQQKPDADPDKFVFIITASYKKWRWKRDDLQLICSASDKINIDPTLTQIREHIPIPQ